MGVYIDDISYYSAIGVRDFGKGSANMRRSETCPKCESKSISYADRIYSGGGFGGKEYIGLEPKVLGGMNRRFVAYTCEICGYSEMYLVND